MSNILIINGAKKFAHSNGQLNDTLTEVADGTLRAERSPHNFPKA